MEIPIEFHVNHFIIAIYAFTFVSQTQLLYKCFKAKREEQLNTPVLINITAWCLKSIFGVVVFTFIELHIIKKSAVFLCLNTIFVSLSGVLSTSVAFLLLDRLFILKFPIYYRDNRRLFTGIASFSCFFIALIIAVPFFLANSYFDQNDCWILCGVKDKEFLILVSMRLTLGPIILALGVSFLWTLHKFSRVNHQHQQYRKANFLTLISLITEVLCNLLPNIFNIITLWLLSRSLGVLDFPALMLSIDSLITALTYRYIISVRSKKTGPLSSNSHPRVSRP